MNTQPILNIEGCGTIDEAGFVCSMDKQGFDKFKSICEIISNSIDAGSKNIRFHICSNKLFILDDGNGMDENKARNMFAAHRENHTGDRTMGTAGIGGKIATKILSQINGVETETEVTIITHHKSSENKYITITVPWDQIVEQLKYTGKILLNYSSQTEIEQFLKLRIDNKFDQYGTTICFQLNDNIVDILDKQFNCIQHNIPISQQISNIFGRFTTINISYKKNLSEPISIQHYDYFGGQEIDYYSGIDKYDIEIYKNKHKKDYILRYLFIDHNSNKLSEFKKDGRGTRKEHVSITNQELKLLEYVGNFTLFIAMRKDKDIFDEDDANVIQDPFQGTKELDWYDRQFVDDAHGKSSLRNDFCHTSLVRNNQYIVSSKIDNFKSENMRGDAISSLRILRTHSELRYYTESSQKNSLDDIINIQLNKNQHSGVLPIELVRIISYYRDYKWNTIRQHFNQKIKEKEDYLKTLETERKNKKQRKFKKIKLSLDNTNDQSNTTEITEEIEKVNDSNKEETHGDKLNTSVSENALSLHYSSSISMDDACPDVTETLIIPPAEEVLITTEEDATIPVELVHCDQPYIVPDLIDLNFNQQCEFELIEDISSTYNTDDEVIYYDKLKQYISHVASSHDIKPSDIIKNIINNLEENYKIKYDDIRT